MLHHYNKRAVRDVSGSGAWELRDLLAAYHWPVALTGRRRIGIVELGGGWRQSDLILFSARNSLAAPNVTDISVDGMTNRPGVDPDSDGEVGLDIQIAGGAYAYATGVPADIGVYWGQSIAACINRAMQDHCAVCSISWGDDEALWAQQDVTELLLACQSATANGMIICAAAGDNDSSDGGPNAANVDLPGSNPYILSCGGTKLLKDGREFVWNNDPGKPSGEGTGGGFSALYASQTWQSGAPPPPPGTGRMVPDISANADPETGYNVILNGVVTSIGGTSAVAPLFAGLFGAVGPVQGLAIPGLVGPKLWRHPECFRDILPPGDNGMFHVLAGPDACTGLGSPNGAAIAAMLLTP
jgi:kumamolisin